MTPLLRTVRTPAIDDELKLDGGAEHAADGVTLKPTVARTAV